MAETTKRQQSGNRKPGRPKGSTSKKTGTSSKSRGTTGKKAYEQDNTEFMRAEVVIICSFAVAILLFLSNFKLCGVVGDVLRGVQLDGNRCPQISVWGIDIPPFQIFPAVLRVANRPPGRTA